MAKKIFQRKKKFIKQYKIFDTKTDWEMDQRYKFALAADPSRDTLYGLMAVVTTSPEQLDELSPQELDDLDEQFYHYVSELTIECDIAGLDFDTSETTRESFSHPDVDWHFLFSVYGHYVGYILEHHKTLGKVLRQSTEPESSGIDNKPKESPLTSQSGTE